MNRGLAMAMLATCLACGPRVGDEPPETVCENLPVLEESEVHTLELSPGEDGTPVIATLRAYTGPRHVRAHATGDVDGDGHRDVVVAVAAQAGECEGRQYLRVFFGTNEGRLTAGPAIPLEATGTTPPPKNPQLAAHDIDGDQRAEVMVYEDVDPLGSNEIRILTVRDDSIELRDTLDFGQDHEPSILAVGDFDASGTTDFFVAFSPTLYEDVTVGCGPRATFVLDVADPSRRVEVPLPVSQGSGHALAVRTDGVRDAVLTRVECQALELSELSVDSEARVEMAPVPLDDPGSVVPVGIAADLNADGRSDLVLRPSGDRLLIRITPENTITQLWTEDVGTDAAPLYGAYGIAKPSAVNSRFGYLIVAVDRPNTSPREQLLFVPHQDGDFEESSSVSFPLQRSYGLDGSLSSGVDSVPSQAVFLARSAEDPSQLTNLWLVTVSQ